MIRSYTIGRAITLFVALLLTYSSIACDVDGITGIVEENDLQVPVNSRNSNDMTEERFNQIIDEVAQIYRPIIEAKDKELQVIKRWNDATVNAFAQQQGRIWKISMFGGLARHETITDDAFALVVCHELGHHLGGAPKKGGWFGSTWASNEGQSDYWGNLKCMRKYMAKQNNIQIVSEMEVDTLAAKECETRFTLKEDQAICKRGAMAGLSLGELFRALRKLKEKIHFSTPDKKVVSMTNHNHPAPQCRLDTYYAGALCDASENDDVSNTDAKVGTCNRSDDYLAAARPLCWFKPSL